MSHPADAAAVICLGRTSDAAWAARHASRHSAGQR